MSSLLVWSLLAVAAEHGPARLTDHTPAWLELGLDHRTRYEYLSVQWRPVSTGPDMALSLRTRARLGLRLGPVRLRTEWMDARFYLDDADTPRDTALGNPLDLLQATVGLDLDDVFAPGARLIVTAGRQTLDVGSRRLIARNRYRNTLNAFTGVDAQWTHPEGERLRVFAVVPVSRLPSDEAGLDDNQLVFDREDPSTLLWGVGGQSRPLGADWQLEGYLLGLHDTDRSLVTPNLRIWHDGAVDAALEVALQAGESSAEPHLAGYLTATVGVTAAHATEPRVGLNVEYATGDQNPDDGVQNRFDALYGARRFAYGPTGLYGVFARSNLASPELRVSARPLDSVDAMAAWRVAWLASATDAWTPSKERDTSGGAGSYLGQQVEVRLRWDPLDGKVRVEGGYAHLFLGDFQRNLRDNPEEPDSDYVYAQVAVTL